MDYSYLLPIFLLLFFVIHLLISYSYSYLFPIFLFPVFVLLFTFCIGSKNRHEIINFTRYIAPEATVVAVGPHIIVLIVLIYFL